MHFCYLSCYISCYIPMARHVSLGPQTQLAAKIPVRAEFEAMSSQSCKNPCAAMFWRYNIFLLLWMHFCYAPHYISRYIPIAMHLSLMSMNPVSYKDPVWAESEAMGSQSCKDPHAVRIWNSCYFECISVMFPVTFHFRLHSLDTSVGLIQDFIFPEICQSSPIPRFQRPVLVWFVPWDQTRYPISNTDRFWTSSRSGQFSGQTQPQPDQDPLLILYKPTKPWVVHT